MVTKKRERPNNRYRRISRNKGSRRITGPYKYGTLAYRKARLLAIRNPQYKLFYHGGNYYLARKTRGIEDPDEPQAPSPDDK
jgi:hypothetical protein